jgi:hypothetical protein
VKLSSDGRVKVLDFGLAKAWAGELPLGQDLRPVLHVVTNWTSLLR